jgi:HEAT repeat protein
MAILMVLTSHLKNGVSMKHSKGLILLVFLSLTLNSCSFIKKLSLGKKGEAPSVTFELIDKLRIAYEDGRIQALEELISIYNDSSLPFEARIEAGKVLGDSQHPTALNAIAQTVSSGAALDITFMEESIKLLTKFRENPKAAEAMIQGMENIELKTNSLHMTLVRSLNKIRVEDQVLALLDLYEIAHANVERTDLLLAETLGAIGTEEVVPILVSIAKNPGLKIGVRNRAVEILGKKDPADVANAFAELLNDPATNLEVREFALKTMRGVKQENLILALLNTYNAGRNEYYSLLNTLLEALGNFDDPQVFKAIIQIGLTDDLPIDLRKKAIESLGGLNNPNVIPRFLPLLSDAKNYTLHGSIVQMVGRLGKQDLYHEEIRRLAFTAHMKESQYIVP